MSFFKKVKSAATGALVGGLSGAAVGGPLGAAVGGVAGAGMSLYSDSENRKQNKANQRAIDRANAYDLAMWEKTNAYNSPTAQMQRLAAAGLNPNLVYGSGNVTGNTAGVPGSNGYVEAVRSNKFANAVQMAQMSANLASTRQEISKSQAQEDYTKAQTQNLNNFLSGKGPSTFTRPNNDVPVLQETPETTDDFLTNLIEGGINFIPHPGTRVGVRKVFTTAKNYGITPRGWREYADAFTNPIGYSISKVYNGFKNWRSR